MKNRESRPGGRTRILAIVAAVGLTLLSSALRAQTIKSDPDPGDGRGYVDYVGHYAEVFKLRGGWQIAPFMSRGTEVINLYPKRDRSAPAGSFRIFSPKPSDFVPENFTRLGLIQLMIIPRSSDSFRSLDELKTKKIRDLKASGVRFEVVEDPFFPPARGRWPAGTFEIKVSAPYLLTQLYTATPAYTCILTSGVDTPPSTFIRDHYDDLRYALAAWLVPQDRVAPDESPSATVAKGISLHPFAVPAVWLSWFLITGFALLLGALGIKMHWGVLRRASFSLLIFSNAGAILGGALGLALWPLAWFTHHFPILGGIACLFTPVLALLVGRFRGAEPSRRALIGTSLWALAAATFFAYGGAFDWGAGGGGDRARYLLSFGAILGFCSYAVGGVIFGVLDSPGSPLRIAWKPEA